MTDIARRWTLREISEASGVPYKTLQYRYYNLKRKGAIADTVLFTYEQVQQLMRVRQKAPKPRGPYINNLMNRLKSDGYPVRK